MPRTGSGAVSTESGEPNELSTAAFIVFVLFRGMASFWLAWPARSLYPDLVSPWDGLSSWFLAPTTSWWTWAGPSWVISCVLGANGSGLRREEVAELADIGVDWYIRLEQGRHVTPRWPRSMRWPGRCVSAQWNTAPPRPHPQRRAEEVLPRGDL